MKILLNYLLIFEGTLLLSDFPSNTNCAWGGRERGSINILNFKTINFTFLVMFTHTVVYPCVLVSAPIYEYISVSMIKMFIFIISIIQMFLSFSRLVPGLFESLCNIYYLIISYGIRIHYAWVSNLHTRLCVLRVLRIKFNEILITNVRNVNTYLY